MRLSPKEQRLEALEDEFNALLIPCLKECANGRWGLFGQNQHPESVSALLRVEAERLKELAKEIRDIRPEFVTKQIQRVSASSSVAASGVITSPASRNVQENFSSHWV
jgi:hypothetical protein